jgi:hypothetical protein
MSMRFRQSFQLFPGVRINVGARGVSASFGVPGAAINVGAQGVRATVGIPASGLSYSTMLTGGGQQPGWPGAAETKVYQPHQIEPVAGGLPQSQPYVPMIGMREIGSASVEGLTSGSLLELRNMIVSAREQRAEVEQDLSAAKTTRTALASELERRRGSLLRWFYRKRITALDEDLLPTATAEVERLTVWREATHIDVSFEAVDAAQRAYAQFIRAFESLVGAERVWDATSDRDADRVRERTSASRTVDRRPVELSFSSSDLIRFAGRALRFGNVNGEDILLYPGLALMPRADGMFAMIDLRELEINYSPHNFIEDGAVPSDALVAGHTWAKVNKDGSPDRRFRDNYQIPICIYGKLIFSTGSGVAEEYQVSQVQAAGAFAASFAVYRQALSSGAAS